MHVLNQIERAIKKLYRLDHPYRAQDFLAGSEPPFQKQAANSNREGMVVFSNQWNDFQISIVLSPRVQKHLKHFKQWEQPWRREYLNSFSVAVEELSHFHYLIYRAIRKVPSSLLELELQGEIDRFVIAFFTLSRDQPAEKVFDFLLRSFFEEFKFSSDLTTEQKQRYQRCNDLAFQFIKNLKPKFLAKDKKKLLQILRKTFEKAHHDKIAACINHFH